MRIWGCVIVLVCACTKVDTLPIGDPSPSGTYAFGPYTLAANQEISDQCVQITLHNDAPIYVNQVELTTGAGFHHSNWFYVPENQFVDSTTGANDDTTFKCDDRKYTEPAAALLGGVLFAQSTQAPHEVQAFPEHVAIRIPPHSKLFAQIHLLNASDAPISLSPWIGLTAIIPADATTLMAGVSFENQTIQLPPNARSSFALECDIASKHEQTLGYAPNFKFYYGLGHYHTLGTKVEVDAVRDDGSSAVIFSTANHVGDVLGGPIDPPFDFTGYTKIRFTCEYYNPRAQTVYWGIGDQEMCVFLAFTDSPYNWAGGVTSTDSPGPGTDVNGVMSYQHACDVYGIDASH